MQILAIADQETAFLWDHFDRSHLAGIDLIISCGDLSGEYLSFLATMTSAPVLYVHGNHDDNERDRSPGGCICIEDRIFVYRHVRILGLGGSMRYREGAYQYTERQMRNRVRRLFPALVYHRGFDILVTHAPAYALHDGADLPHQGFQTFTDLLTRYRPRFFLHGHVHPAYGRGYPRYDQVQGTHVINACGMCTFPYEDRFSFF